MFPSRLLFAKRNKCHPLQPALLRTGLRAPKWTLIPYPRNHGHNLSGIAGTVFGIHFVSHVDRHEAVVGLI